MVRSALNHSVIGEEEPRLSFAKAKTSGGAAAARSPQRSLPQVWVGCQPHIVRHVLETLPEARRAFDSHIRKRGCGLRASTRLKGPQRRRSRSGSATTSSSFRRQRAAVATELGPLTHLPHVTSKGRNRAPGAGDRQAFLDETDTTFSEGKFAEFCLAFEEVTPLEFHEIGALVPALKLVLLEEIAARGRTLVNDPTRKPGKRVTTCIRSLENVTQASWTDVLERLVPFDGILREDPAGAYAGMDIESRNVYRERVSRIAERSDRTELEVAEEALALARQAHERKYRDPRIGLRESHIGFYLVGEGTDLLCQRVGFHPSFGERFRSWLRRHPDEFLLFGIAALTLAIITGTLFLLTPPTTSPLLVLLSMLILLLPSSQAAVQLMNYVITNLLPVEALPKLDFSKGVPDDCVTLVAIPTLLLSEKQVHILVEDLEVRFLGNHDRNIHFALVSDLPDSNQPSPEESSLVALCSKLIEELNRTIFRERIWARSFFSIATGSTTRAKKDGWDGSASAASCSI